MRLRVRICYGKQGYIYSKQGYIYGKQGYIRTGLSELGKVRVSQSI